MYADEFLNPLQGVAFRGSAVPNPDCDAAG